MKPYPSIPSWSQKSGLPVYTFDKCDGSSVRCEVDRKGVMSKFGKRHGLLDDQTPFLREAEVLIPETYGDLLGRMVKDQRWESATFYFEFFGATSFAGTHYDEPHQVVLFDIAPHKKGIIEPREFLKLCGDTVPHAALLHQGNFTQDIAQQVSNGTLEGMTFEGVVCKGSYDRKLGMPMMFKWKNIRWLEKLKGICGSDDKMFQALS